MGDGANVVLVARNVDDLEKAAADLAAVAGPDQQLVVRPADTADPDAIAELFAWVRAELPGLNILVANAGSGAVIPFLERHAGDVGRDPGPQPDRHVPVPAGGGPDHGRHAGRGEPVDGRRVVDPGARASAPGSRPTRRPRPR